MKKENTYKKIFIKLTNSNKKKRMGIILNWNFCLHLGIGICIFYGFKSGMCAIIAVKRIGLNQIKDIPEELFVDLPQYYNMFKTRLNILQNV